jgi:DNA-binding PucR family transcriptional regulator
VPRSLAVLAVAGHSPGSITRRLGIDALVGTDAVGVFLVLPDPDGPGRPAEIARAVEDEVAALGPTVPPRDAARSLHWSRLALGLVERGRLTPAKRPRGPVRVDDHLASVILLQDEELAGALASSRLQPLAELPAAERDRLLETLEAWLDHQRHVPGIAEALHVHPQTVRYRVAKLRELVGDALDTPGGRFELELALRARRALED